MITILNILLLLNSNFHDIHISKTEINYKPDQHALQLTVNMFIDDLELAIVQDGGSKMNLFEKNETPESDSLISQYIYNHLSIKVDNKEVEYYYIGKEISDDLEAAWCYLEFEDLNTFETITVENDIMIDLYDDQKNIVNIMINSKSKAFHMLDEGLLKKTIKL